MSGTFDAAYWDDHYDGSARGQGHPPGVQLVAEAAGLTPGRALDAGCGTGAGALWLAARGWRVTAVDVAEAALERAREQARACPPEVRERVAWVRADLTTWLPDEGGFDLVTAQHVHTAAGGDVLHRRLAALVAPGGTLLVVGHAPSDVHSAEAHGRPASAHTTAEEVAAVLDPSGWDVLVAEVRSRASRGHDGSGAVAHDAVLRARRHG